MIIFSHGDKGGVGKSFFAKAFIDFCLRNHYPVMPVDCDTRNADVHQVVDPVLHVDRLNLRTEEGWAQLVDMVVAHRDTHNIVVSLPAGIGEQDEQFGTIFTQAMHEIDATIKLFWLLNHEAEGIKLLRHLLDTKVYTADHIIVVRNLFFGEDFSFWMDSKTRQQFLAGGGCECDLPALSRRITDFLTRENLFLSHGRDQFRIYDRINFDTWAHKIDEAIRELNLDLIGPSQAGA